MRTKTQLVSAFGPVGRLCSAAIILIAVLATIKPVLAQPIAQIINSTGDGINGFDGGLDIAVDSASNVYVTGWNSSNAFKVTPGGTITQIIDSTGDGTNSLVGAGGVAVDSADNVYVTGIASNNCFKITPGGTITQIIDSTGDGTNSLIGQTSGIAVDSADNVYVTGPTSNNAFKITPGGTITQIIDSTGDGTSGLSAPFFAAADSAGNVYVTGATSHNAFKITPGGTITQIIDSTGDGTNGLSLAYGVAVDSADNVYVSAGSSDNVFRITPGGTITQIIDSTGDGTYGLNNNVYLGVDSADNVYVTGWNSSNAFKVTPGGTITRIINSTGDGTNGLSRPYGVAFDKGDNVYIVGNWSDNAFKIGACGNNSLDVGEECDDGNFLNGDGCSATCQIESCWSCTGDPSNCAAQSSGTPCPDDGNPCTHDVCDGAGQCGQMPTGCKAADKSILLLKNNVDDNKDKLLFKWLKGEQTTLGELGTPTATATYTLCLYAGTTGATSASLNIPGGSKWQPLGTKGFKYKDTTTLDPDGAQKALLKSGVDGKAKVLVKGKGDKLPDDLVPPLSLPVTAQLVNNENSTCFEAVFDTNDLKKNDSKQFKAKKTP